MAGKTRAAKAAKSQPSDFEGAYKAEVTRIKRQMRDLSKRGYSFENFKMPERPKSKKVDQASVNRLKRITLDTLYRKAKYKDPATGKVVSGTTGRKRERKAAAKKGAETKRRNREAKRLAEEAKRKAAEPAKGKRAVPNRPSKRKAALKKPSKRGYAEGEQLRIDGVPVAEPGVSDDDMFIPYEVEEAYARFYEFFDLCLEYGHYEVVPQEEMLRRLITLHGYKEVGLALDEAIREGLISGNPYGSDEIVMDVKNDLGEKLYSKKLIDEEEYEELQWAAAQIEEFDYYYD